MLFILNSLTPDILNLGSQFLLVSIFFLISLFFTLYYSFEIRSFFILLVTLLATTFSLYFLYSTITDRDYLAEESARREVESNEEGIRNLRSELGQLNKKDKNYQRQEQYFNKKLRELEEKNSDYSDNFRKKINENLDRKLKNELVNLDEEQKIYLGALDRHHRTKRSQSRVGITNRVDEINSRRKAIANMLSEDNDMSTKNLIKNDQNLKNQRSALLQKVKREIKSENKINNLSEVFNLIRDKKITLDKFTDDEKKFLKNVRRVKIGENVYLTDNRNIGFDYDRERELDNVVLSKLNTQAARKILDDKNLTYDTPNTKKVLDALKTEDLFTKSGVNTQTDAVKVLEKDGELGEDNLKDLKTILDNYKDDSDVTVTVPDDFTDDSRAFFNDYKKNTGGIKGGNSRNLLNKFLTSYITPGDKKDKLLAEKTKLETAVNDASKAGGGQPKKDAEEKLKKFEEAAAKKIGDKLYDLLASEREKALEKVNNAAREDIESNEKFKAYRKAQDEQLIAEVKLAKRHLLKETENLEDASDERKERDEIYKTLIEGDSLEKNYTGTNNLKDIQIKKGGNLAKILGLGLK